MPTEDGHMDSKIDNITGESIIVLIASKQIAFMTDAIISALRTYFV